MKFTNDGGRITFDATYRPGKDARHMIACYRVADTGMGMSPEFVAHIFDEFSQEESSARTKYKGTGLGMNGHLSKPIVIDEVVKAIAGNLKG